MYTHSKQHLLMIGALVLGVCAGAPRAVAAVPTEFTVQGVLRDSGGALQSVPVHLIVAFFDSQSAGTQISTGTYDMASVATVNGLFTQTFSLTASDVTALGAASQVWMEVTAGSDVFGRQKVTPELYSLFSRRAEQADALSAACSGCVGNAALASGIAGSKITGAVANATNAVTATNATNATNATSATTAATATSATTAGMATTATTAATATSANGLQGRPVVSTAPTNLQCLGYNSGKASWEPETVVTSVVGAGGLGAGMAGSVATVSLPTTIPSDRTFQGKVTFSNALGSTGLAQLMVLDSVGNTAAQFGSSHPVFIGNNNSSIGFNTYNDGATWKTGTSTVGAGIIAVDNGSNFTFSTGQTIGAGNTAIAERTQLIIEKNGRLQVDASDMNIGQLNNTTFGPGVSFGAGSGEGIASRRHQDIALAEDTYGLDFYTDFILRMTIKNNGTVEIDRTGANQGGLSGTNPAFPGLSFGHNSGEGIASKRQGAGGGINGLDFYTAGTRRMWIENGGKIYRQNDGASFDQLSDERLKDIAGTYERGLDAILAIMPIRYHYKTKNPLGLDPKIARIGVTAQSLARAVPEAVSKSESGYLSIQTDPLLWTMVNAIKEQHRDVTHVEAEMETLRKANARLAADNAELRAHLAKLEGALSELAAREAQKANRLARK